MEDQLIGVAIEKRLEADESNKERVDGLSQEQQTQFWFPHKVKYVAWFLVVSTILVCSIFLVWFGLKFGPVKSYLWFTTVSGSLLVTIFITQPVKIVIMAGLSAYFIKKADTITKKKLTYQTINNTLDDVALTYVRRLRDSWAALYTPLTPSYLKVRREDIKFTLELRTLTIDILLYVMFMTVLYYVVMAGRSDMAFHSRHVVEELVVTGQYTNSIKFTDVLTMDDFINYLNQTLLPALLTNGNGTHNTTGRKENQANITGVSEEDEMSERGWTLESNMKLLGKPRLRQVRVFKGACTYPRQVIEASLPVTSEQCTPELTLWNEDTTNYSLHWTESPHGEDKRYKGMQIQPWRYQTSWESATVPVVAKAASYPGGGYVLELGKSLVNAHISLEYLVQFQWIDAATRAVFIEFTTYAANTNMFNVVHLVVERSPAGFFIPTYNIYTAKFLFLSTEIRIMATTMFVFFVVFLGLFFLRETIRMKRVTLKTYFLKVWTLLDLSIAIIGFVCILFYLLRSQYVSSLLKQLEVSANNAFVSFEWAAYWDRLSTYLNAVLVCLATIKLFRLLSFRVVFRQLEVTLSYCLHPVLMLSGYLSLVILAFTCFFHLSLVYHDYSFSSYTLSFSTMLSRAISMDDEFDFRVFGNLPWFMGTIFFGVFALSTTFILMNMFIAVICYYLSEVQQSIVHSKYSVWKYIRHRCSGEPDVLTVGNREKDPKFKRQSRKTSESEMEGEEQDKGTEDARRQTVEEETHNGDFIKRKLVDEAAVFSPELLRMHAMRHLALSLVQPSDQQAERIKAMAAIALSTWLSNTPTGSFYVIRGQTRRLFVETGRVEKMRRIVEKLLQKQTTGA